MAKFNEEFKLRVNWYIFTKKHGMEDSTPIIRWVKAFEKSEWKRGRSIG
ncbi:hypothetical protein [Peribacillus deserti]|nr:hypothetical protein [Peribacillus deserti]